MTPLFVLLQIVINFTLAPVEASATSSIPINVVYTFQLSNETDIQDIAFNDMNNTLAVRSNEAGKIYIVDLDDYILEDSIPLPTGCTGFGLGVSNYNNFYINSDSSPMILYSDGGGTWNEYVNPAGTQGAGLDCYSSGSPLITQLNSTPTHQLFAYDVSDSTQASYPFNGVSDEISGYMGHEVATDIIYPPSTTITTTRFGYEFFFHYLGGSDEYSIYGQEPTPIPVSESLGLSWLTYTDHIFWSYRGTDLEYYISVLQIPVFGSIEDDQSSISPTPQLQIISNPSVSTASISVNTTSTAQTTVLVYDVYGRRAEVLFDGVLTSGADTFSFTGAPGVYTVVLQNEETPTERARLILID